MSVYRLSNSLQPVVSDKERIHRLSDSSSIRDKAQGLRTVSGKVADGQVDAAQSFFADVVKQVFERDLEIREMAAAYLIMFSQHEPESTLMIVNAVQKMLQEKSAVVRLQALRLASALRVPTVAPIVIHLISQVTNDPSPLVRAACCQAIGNCYQVDPSLGPELSEMSVQMSSLPRQTGGDYAVAGWGLATSAQNWPQRIDSSHSLWRAYVPHIFEFDEWCQITVCPMLVRYCRHYLNNAEDEDAKLLVDSVQPSSLSLNTAVVLESAAVVLYVGNEKSQQTLLPAVVQRLVALSSDSALVWSGIEQFAKAHPKMFTNYRGQMITRLASYKDSQQRIHALRTISFCSEKELNKQELWHLRLCATAWQDDVASLRMLMTMVTKLIGPTLVQKTITWSTTLATDSNQSPELVSESLMTLRVLVQQHRTSTSVLPALLRKMAQLVVSSQELLVSARATIIWLIGVHCIDIPAVSTELLRKLLASEFAAQADEVRYQTIQLAAKINTAYKNDTSQFDERSPRFFSYAIELGKYDPNVDIRDRVRLFETLNNAADNSMATLSLQAAKPVPSNSSNVSVGTDDEFLVDSVSAYFKKPMDGFTPSEPWSKHEDTSSLREQTVLIPPASSSDTSSLSSTKTSSVPQTSKPLDKSLAQKVKQMSLEEFLTSPKKNKTSIHTTASSSEEETEEGTSSSEDEVEEESEDDDEAGEDVEEEAQSEQTKADVETEAHSENVASKVSGDESSPKSS